jgi:predicted signal transduction protein with EAL and GGDEF domain
LLLDFSGCEMRASYAERLTMHDPACDCLHCEIVMLYDARIARGEMKDRRQRWAVFCQILEAAAEKLATVESASERQKLRDVAIKYFDTQLTVKAGRLAALKAAARAKHETEVVIPPTSAERFERKRMN